MKQYNAKSKIPTILLWATIILITIGILNGSIVYSATVDFAIYGVNYVNFDLNIGALEGVQTMTAWVNRDDYMSETRTGNNTISTTFHVKKVVELTTSYIAPNADYVEGNDVVTSFYVKNSSAAPILPSDNMDFTFEVYTLNGSDEVMIQVWTPAGMITAVRNSNAIMIDGTIYDDFYVGS